MEWLTDIVKSGNALNIVLLGVLLFVLVKSKFLQVHTDHLQIGAHEDERAIMRRQFEYTRSTLEASVRDFPDDLDPEKTKNVIHEITNIFEDMIVFNHIKDDKEYISIKQKAVYNKVLGITTHVFFRTDEFKTICDATVADIIQTLVRIRKTYK